MFEQTINVYGLLKFSGVVLTIIVAAISITRAIKKGYKNYIDNKLELVNMEILTIKKDIEEDKKYNEKEHDRLTLLFDKIDSKLDRIIENKSA